MKFMEKIKIVVAHPEQQHSYRLATAIKELGYLEKYITTVYYKNNSITKFISYFLPKKFQKRAKTRQNSYLEDEDVIQYKELEGLIKLLSFYFPPLKRYYNKIRLHVADKFASKVIKFCIKVQADVVITYDNCSPILFKELHKKLPNTIRILDMSAANIFFMKNIYEKDFEIVPLFANMLKTEREYIWDNSFLMRISDELKYSQYFLVPSNFVKKSLLYSGIHERQMLLCPYGVDLDDFHLKDYHVPKPRNTIAPINFIYVGGVKQLKGIYYLLEAFCKVPEEIAHLTVVGAYSKDTSEIFSKYKKHVCFTGQVMHREVIHLLHSSDVFVFPSLGDSFSLSAMEAAACGLPLIVSENTGMSDYMQNGVEGIIVRTQSIDDIVQAINWFVDHSEVIPQMGKAARRMAESLSWQHYSNTIEQILEFIIDIKANEHISN